MTGRQCGRLTVIRRSGTTARGAATWECNCVCGNLAYVSGPDLRAGRVQSCGCLKLDRIREVNSTHGLRNTVEYKTWSSMKDRCTNPNAHNFENYGGRGIKVCDRWLNSVEAFIEDMGKRPSARHSLDRIDNDGDYEPVNCRWATNKEQSNNRRTNHTFEIDGEVYTLQQLVELSGISKAILYGRLAKGLTIEQALELA